MAEECNSLKKNVSKIKSGSYKTVFLLGPTAVGKSALSFYLAEKMSAGILNCDSISMYRGLDIGSAKPSLGKVKNIPLFLFDEWEPPFTCTAGLFRKKALEILSQELKNQSMLVVGGSGFYVQALEKGMYPLKKVSLEIKQEVKNIYKKKGLEHLYKMLVFLDPVYAKTVYPQDTYRILRGIGIILSEEKPLSLIRSHFKAKKFPWPYVKVGLHLGRDALLKNIQTRTNKMVKEGLLEEVQTLLNKGLEDWPLMKSVGYKEAVLCLKDQISKEEMRNRIVLRTMHLAKKQLSWFKRDKNIHWFLPEEKEKIHQFLKK